MLDRGDAETQRENLLTENILGSALEVHTAAFSRNQFPLTFNPLLRWGDLPRPLWERAGVRGLFKGKHSRKHVK